MTIAGSENSRNVLGAALAAHAAGISTIPVKADGSKKPAITWKQWEHTLPPLALIHQWFTQRNCYGLAVVGGGVSQHLEIVDFDLHDVFDRFEQEMRAQGHGPLLDRMKRGYYEESPRGAHLPYRCKPALSNTKLAMRYDRDEHGNIKRNEKGTPLKKALIETRGEGGFCIVAPTNGKVHETGRPYVLVSGGFETIASITPEEREVLFAVARTLSECPEEEEEPRTERPHTNTSGGRPGDDFNARATWEEILEPHGWRIDHVHNGETYWTRPGKDRDTSATTNYQGSELLYVFSTSTPFEAERGYSKFSAYALLNHDNDFHKAAAALALDGYGTSQTTAEPQEQNFDDLKDTPDGHPPADFRPCTDLGNGERLIDRYGDNLRFCNQWKKWLVWNGEWWEPDDTQKVRQWAKTTVRGIYDSVKQVTEQAKKAEEAEKKELLAKRAAALVAHAVKSEASWRVDAMIREAQKDCPVLPAHLDADPWLLNVLNGTLDLRTGQLRRHARDDLLTKHLALAYNAEASCPTWEAFLESTFAGKQDLIDYLQRGAGYTLTGDTSEQCLFFLHGSGANGKSTLLEIFRAVLSEYSQPAEFSTFLHKDRDAVRNDLAKLRGARFVTAIEVEEGRRLAESVVKHLTGGDVITARFLFAEYFDFRPSFKLWLAANHKPVIRGTDYAIWRRIHLIPFSVKFEGENKDSKIADKLMQELPGILAWMVRGCLAWQREGLAPPEIVQAATEEYRKEMDVIGNFLNECCEQKPHLQTKAAALYNAYVLWSSDKLTTQIAFSKALRDRGFTSKRSNGAWWLGIGLHAETSED